MSKYLNQTDEEREETLSNFLIDSWSYSKVTTFSRNEKAFEMSYVFHCPSRISATTIAGQAYHYALQYYFLRLRSNDLISIADAEILAFNYIDEVQGNKWKLQKTTPTVEEAKAKATSIAISLLRNFFGETDVYESELAEVIDVELHCREYITVNGVDLPLPCNAVIDLVIRTRDGRIIIVDHKSKSSYTADDEISLSAGVQAITYIKCFEAKTGTRVDEVWFIENKFSQNKDKTPQLRAFKITLDDNTRRLYESLLYEPLRRMLSATSDPDYVYMINDSDNYVDRAELYDFWAKTIISEVEDFSIPDNKKTLIEKRLKKIRDSSSEMITPSVIKQFKENAASFIQYDLSHTNMTQKEKIEHVLRSFAIIVNVAHELEGFSSNTFLIEVSAGVKLSSIHSHRLDIANVLDVSTVRISNNLVVYNSKSYLAIEFSKQRIGDLSFNPSDLIGRKIPIGKDNYSNTVVWDLNNHSTPHMLMCGATGSGKSVSIRSTIEYALLCGVDEIVILDPKFEFTRYRGVNNASVYNEIIDIEVKMSDLVDEMNALVKSGATKMTLVVFDEFADAMSQSRSGVALDVKEMVQVGNYAPKKGAFGIPIAGEPKMKLQKTGELRSLEENMRILLQKGRSSGFRIMAATQRASVKVITGDAKVNFPVQVCFRVPKEADSRVVLDETGAEGLSGAGDGLIKSPEYNDVVRFQAYYFIERRRNECKDKVQQDYEAAQKTWDSTIIATHDTDINAVVISAG